MYVARGASRFRATPRGHGRSHYIKEDARKLVEQLRRIERRKGGSDADLTADAVQRFLKIEADLATKALSRRRMFGLLCE